MIEDTPFVPIQAPSAPITSFTWMWNSLDFPAFDAFAVSKYFIRLSGGRILPYDELKIWRNGRGYFNKLHRKVPTIEPSFAVAKAQGTKIAALL